MALGGVCDRNITLVNVSDDHRRAGRVGEINPIARQPRMTGSEDAILQRAAHQLLTLRDRVAGCAPMHHA
jgi:hypothetical protein